MRFKYYLRGAGIGVIVATLILSIAFLFQDNISDEEVIRRAMKLGMVMEENTPGTLADLQNENSVADLESGADDGPLPDEDALNGDGNTNADDQTSVPDGSTEADDPSDPGKVENPDQDTSASDDSGQQGSRPADDDDSSDPDKSSDPEKPSDQKPSDNKPSDNKTQDKPSDSKPSDKDKPDDSGQGDKADESGEVVITIESGDVSRMVSAKVFEAGLVESADEFNSYLGAHDYDNKLQPGTHKIPKGASFKQIAQILTSR